MSNSSQERRRHSRFPLGLRVGVHLVGHPTPITVELLDLSAGGGRFRAVSHAVRIDQGAAFGFVVPGEKACVANGRIVRVEPGGEFVVSLDDTNEAFRDFVARLGRHP